MSKKIITTIAIASLMTVLFATGALAASTADTGISQSIRQALGKDSGVRVFTHDGTVYLRGEVYNVNMIPKAVEIAAANHGVNRVVNQLGVYTD